MSAIEETKSEIGVNRAAGVSVASARASVSPVTRLLNLLSSVRFGVTLLVLLVVASMIGMLWMQQSVEGFDKYYAQLTPAQRMLYGGLGFFDIYHSWYFNVLLLILSLNIVLASIDRFPQAWTFISRPKLDASARWLSGQTFTEAFHLAGANRASVAERISQAAAAAGFKARVTEKGNRTFVFAERAAWNRLGAYAVHVALLTIFFGGFMTAQFGRTGQMRLKPGTTSNSMAETVFNLDQLGETSVALPFAVTCEDIQQKLIKKEGPITADNTIDWLTKIKIKDEAGEREALVHLNRPYDYRGFRFFQASFIYLGRARNIALKVTPEAGGAAQDVSIPRGGSTTLPDGTRLEFADFFPDFTLAGGQPSTATGDYNNPTALLSVTPPAGSPQQAYAFSPAMADSAPFAKRAVVGYTYRLADFEKVPDAHVLSIQRDPGSNIFYLGSAMLFFALSSVFFFSHQRAWAVIEERGAGDYAVTVGANTNRNVVALEDRCRKFVNAIKGVPNEVHES